MKYTKVNNNYIIRLEISEKIIETLTQFCQTENIVSGHFQGIGAVKSATLAFYYIEQKQYGYKQLQELEIVSMTGNISLVDGKAFIHVHTVLSDTNFQAFGGHLQEGEVGATCEIHLTSFETPIARVYDENIGLKLLSCEIVE